MFQKKSAETPLQTTKPMSGSTFSVLGSDVHVKGNVTASADLHIDGHIDGDVTSTSLVQGESSEIVGAIKADSARLLGMVRGTVSAGSLVIGKSARIDGDVSYDTLTIEHGAQVDGRLSQRCNEPKLLTAQ